MALTLLSPKPPPLDVSDVDEDDEIKFSESGSYFLDTHCKLNRRGLQFVTPTCPVARNRLHFPMAKLDSPAARRGGEYSASERDRDYVVECDTSGDFDAEARLHARFHRALPAAEHCCRALLSSQEQFQSLDEAELLGTIGRGSCGSVRICRRRCNTGSSDKRDVYYAVKLIPCSEAAQVKRFQSELRALRRTRCGHVVSYHGVFYQDFQFYLVLEYMNLGSLQDVLSLCRRLNVVVPEHIIAKLAAQILHGLDYLQSIGIIHRDIKPSNLLINSMGVAKLADFGESKALRDTAANGMSFVGTLNYMAPERLLNDAYSYECDVWSLGLVLAEAALGYYPFESAVSQLQTPMSPPAGSSPIVSPGCEGTPPRPKEVVVAASRRMLRSVSPVRLLSFPPAVPASLSARVSVSSVSSVPVLASKVSDPPVAIPAPWVLRLPSEPNPPMCAPSRGLSFSQTAVGQKTPHESIPASLLSEASFAIPPLVPQPEPSKPSNKRRRLGSSLSPKGTKRAGFDSRNIQPQSVAPFVPLFPIRVLSVGTHPAVVDAVHKVLNPAQFSLLPQFPPLPQVSPLPQFSPLPPVPQAKCDSRSFSSVGSSSVGLAVHSYLYASNDSPSPSSSSDSSPPSPPRRLSVSRIQWAVSQPSGFASARCEPEHKAAPPSPPLPSIPTPTPTPLLPPTPSRAHAYPTSPFRIPVTSLSSATGAHQPPRSRRCALGTIGAIVNHPPLEFPGSFSPALCTFLTRCLTKSPSQRPSAKTLLTDEFILKHTSLKHTGTCADSVQIAQWLLDVQARKVSSFE